MLKGIYKLMPAILKMALNERQKLLEQIKSDMKPYFNGELISIIFYKTELNRADYKKIRYIIEDMKTDKAIIIYRGEGGETNSGFALAIALRKKFQKQLIFYIPEKACSAHVLPIFLSNGLWMDERAYLTPVDPSIYHYSKNYPCNMLLENAKHPAHNKAKEVFNNTANMVFQILNQQGSLIIDPATRLDSRVAEKIARYFLNPKAHDAQINYAQLKEMKLEANLADSSDTTWQTIKKVHLLSILELNESGKRYLIETTKASFIL